jgi:hypothetical protein
LVLKKESEGTKPGDKNTSPLFTNEWLYVTFESKSGMELGIKTAFGLPKDIKSRFEETFYKANSEGIDYERLSRLYIKRV